MIGGMEEQSRMPRDVTHLTSCIYSILVRTFVFWAGRARIYKCASVCAYRHVRDYTICL
jgi:hypothetical protein